MLRRGLTFIEILIASAILAGALAPIVQSFHTLIVGFGRTSESTHGAFLAQAVMENIRYRLYNFDARFYCVNDTEEARAGKVENQAWKLFFQGLAESEGARWVVEKPAGISRYFLEFENLQGSTLHPVSQESNPALWRALAGYSCEVFVTFDGADEIFDPDNNGKRQVDMARVRVVIHWTDGKDVPQQSFFETILSRLEYEPHEQPTS
ncbi:MAG: prepilin-type N-terminal cleavage/methylation domain-containing protein [Candidatus Wallbacteria bacterium]|nr:prepilin-type N-terminal cleavage/methylation domain-containing protein [Candidatus Wallbacteria bacterium]